MLKLSYLKFNKKQTYYLFISLVIILVDQFTKHLAQKHLVIYVPKYINFLLNFTLAWNTGAAFSLLDSASGWQSVFFLYLNIIISIFILGWLFQLPSTQLGRLKSWGLGLIFGGALGNIIDRFRLGYVIDFLDFHIDSHHWPIFNIADSAVCVGVGLLIIGISLEKNKE